MESSSTPTRAQHRLGAPVLTEKVWNRLRHNGKLVRDEVTSHLPPMLRSLAWQEFQQMPMARWASSLMLLLEPPQPVGLYRRRTRRPAHAGVFDDIPSLTQRRTAEKIYAELCYRPPSVYPLALGFFLSWLAGQAI